MIGGLPLAFAAPAILFGLVLLPVIWWLLRLTPPRPRSEPFAPLSLLARVLKPEETPARSPWWLTALRLLIAALAILALAGPILNPRERTLSNDGPLVLMIDNGWASAPDWRMRVETAKGLIEDAREADVPISIAFTAERRNDATLGDATRAMEQLLAAAPRPVKPEREATVTAIQAALEGIAPGTIAFFSDGIETTGSKEALGRLLALGSSSFHLFEDQGERPVALTSALNGADALAITANRLRSGKARSISLTARDSKGRDIARGAITFAIGEKAGSGQISAPFEIRNDIARIDIDTSLTAAGTRLVDDSFRRRRVALISGEAPDLSQPLLSPLYYISRALAPYADLVEAESADLAKAIPALIARNPAAIIMADIGSLPDTETQALVRWVERGGTLIRFAGPRLAAADGEDPLVPVELRKGERQLGGALSWVEPQPLAAYPPASPFFGLPMPDGITVKRQVLAEPTATLAAKTWASLTDGTPLVTADKRGEGRIVLFHVTAQATWSDLPISGHFVQMLRRVVQLSRATTSGTGSSDAILPPWRLLDANGALLPASGSARPLDLSSPQTPRAGLDNPPGLYGTQDGYVALNLFTPEETLQPLIVPETDIPMARLPIGPGNAIEFRPWLFGLALAGLLADTLIVLVMSGVLGRGYQDRKKSRYGPAVAVLLAMTVFGLPVMPNTTYAQDARAGDGAILDRLDRTHLAYVITGDAELDQISQSGLDGLSRHLAQRTALEPGEAIGVDIETDELAFYPLIYWPISTTASMPSDDAISRIDAYMKSGGTVLFDTHDRIDDFGGGATEATIRLRTILAGLDIPPLAPVPPDHVLTKTFYLLDIFPGRYADGPLWVEAFLDQDQDMADRPARSGDGVSSIMITANDFAAAWAEDETGLPLYPTVPNDPWQREYAIRAGINIVMYMLTGNYKSDQVHIPALLERLGQ